MNRGSRVAVCKLMAHADHYMYLLLTQLSAPAKSPFWSNYVLFTNFEEIKTSLCMKSSGIDTYPSLHMMLFSGNQCKQANAAATEVAIRITVYLKVSAKFGPMF